MEDLSVYTNVPTIKQTDAKMRYYVKSLLNYTFLYSIFPRQDSYSIPGHIFHDNFILS